MSKAKKNIVYDIHSEMLLYFASYMHAVNDGVEEADSAMINTILNTIKNEEVSAVEEVSADTELANRLANMKKSWGKK